MEARVIDPSNKNMKRHLFVPIAVLFWGLAWTAPRAEESAAPETDACSGENCPDLSPVQHDGRVSLSFSSVKIRTLLGILGDVSGFYIYATQSVDGFTSIRVNNAPWEQILKNVVAKHRWTYRQNGDSIIVGPAAEVDWVIERKIFR
jgi:type II secretory pathway component HofQ